MHGDPTLHSLPTLDGSLNTWEVRSPKERDPLSVQDAPIRWEGLHSFLGHSSVSQLRPETLLSDFPPCLLPGGAQQLPVFNHNGQLCLLSVSFRLPKESPDLVLYFLWCPRSGPIKMFLSSAMRNCFLQTTVWEVSLSEGLLCPFPLPAPGACSPSSVGPEVPRCPTVLHSLFCVVISVLQAWGIWAWNSSVR